jgi:hypothetical protein
LGRGRAGRRRREEYCQENAFPHLRERSRGSFSEGGDTSRLEDIRNSQILKDLEARKQIRPRVPGSPRSAAELADGLLRNLQP